MLTFLHFCRIIDNVSCYWYLRNGSFRFEVDLHQFNLRLHHFSQFPFNVILSFFLNISFPRGVCIWRPRYCHAVVSSWTTNHIDCQKLAGLRLVDEVVSHVEIYRSNATEGFSTFQRRSCISSDKIFLILRYFLYLILIWDLIFIISLRMLSNGILACE